MLRHALTSHVPSSPSAPQVHLSNIPSERDSATLYRIVFETIGTLIGATLQGAITTAMVGTTGGGCNNNTIPNRTLDYYGPEANGYTYSDGTLVGGGGGLVGNETPLPYPNSTRKHQAEIQWEIQQTFMIGGGTVGIICLICGQ